MFSGRAATTLSIPYKVLNLSDTAVITITNPASKGVGQIGSKRLSWYKKLLLSVIEKKVRKRVLNDGTDTSKSRKALSIISVISAFLGLIIIITGPGLIGLVFSITGLVTGIMALSKNNSKEHKTMATWGVVVSGVTLGLVIVLIALLAMILDDLF
jgi:hypothetical protein